MMYPLLQAVSYPKEYMVAYPMPGARLCAGLPLPCAATGTRPRRCPAVSRLATSATASANARPLILAASTGAGAVFTLTGVARGRKIANAFILLSIPGVKPGIASRSTA